MKKALQVIQSNLQYEKSASDDQKNLRTSQLWEFIHLIQSSKLSASPTAVAELYENTFACSPLCSDMLYISQYLAPSPDMPEAKLSAGQRIACMTNPLSLTAMKKLTVDMPEAMVISQADFRSACECLASDQADFCILPLCSSVDGYFSAFFKYLRSYDLKINKTVRVTKADGDEEVLFALVSKSIFMRKGADCALISFVGDSPDDFSQLVCAFSDSSFKIVGANSAPLEYNMDKLWHRVEIRLSEEKAHVLLFFLEAALPGYTLLGLY